MRGKKVKVECENRECKTIFEARVADRKRGWGRYCSKSCKTVQQEAILKAQYKIAGISRRQCIKENRKQQCLLTY